MARRHTRSGRGRSSTYRKDSGNTALAIVMMAVAVLVAGGFGYLYYKGTQKEAFDQATLCPESGPRGHLAILVDLTDPVSMTQLRNARSQIEREIDASVLGTMIAIGVVTPDEVQREDMLLMICKPPSGADADALIENKMLIEEKYQEKFVVPLNTMLTKIMTVSEAPSSPIMENLQEFLSKVPEFGEQQDRRLIVLSNLAQHSEVLSFYRGDDWESFEKSGGVKNLARNLSGTKVILLRLPEPPQQSEALEDFWANYFDEQGAKSISPYSMGSL